MLVYASAELSNGKEYQIRAYVKVGPYGMGSHIVAVVDGFPEIELAPDAWVETYNVEELTQDDHLRIEETIRERANRDLE